METARLSLIMDTLMKDRLKILNSQGKENIHIKMEPHIKGNSMSIP